MKGSRAKKEAEAAAAAAGLEPTPPTSGAPSGRPGPVVQEGGKVQIAMDDFKKIVEQIRTNDLLGAAAADALEAAAGRRPVASPQSKGAKELRGEVAESREDGDKPKKKAMNFDAGPVDEIPDIEDKPPSKRASVSDADAKDHDLEGMEQHCEKDAPEPPELNLSPKQNHMRTDLEMWVMDSIPELFGVDDSEELAENLQEDGQADQITFLIAETAEDKQDGMAEKWLTDAPDADKKEEFKAELLAKVRAIQALGPKKKKKKKKADA